MVDTDAGSSFRQQRAENEAGAFLLSWLLLLGFCHGAAAAAATRPAVVNVGALFTFNSTIGRAAKVGIAAAVDDVNRDATVLPGTRLVVAMQDSNCNGFAGILGALQYMEKDVVAILGPQSSVIAHVVCHLADELRVPMVSFAATDPTLTSLEHPYFVRSAHSDAFQMAAVASAVEYYGWKEVTAIFVDDDFGRNGVAVLGDELAARRSKILYKGALRPGATRGDIADLLVNVALMESRVIVLHADVATGLKVFAAAKHLGMVSDGYAWISTDWLTAFLDSSVQLDDAMMEALQGVLALRPHIADSRRMASLTAHWRGESSRMNAYGLYAYDSVWAVARALEAFFSSGGNISFSGNPTLRDRSLNLDGMSVFGMGELLRDKIRAVDFGGVTGPVRFDSSNNLIRPAYDVLNILGNGWRTVGYWSNYSGLSVVPPEELYAMPANASVDSQQLRSVIWPGGTAAKPRGWVFPNAAKNLRIAIPNRVSYQQFVAYDPRGAKGFSIDVFVAAVALLPYPVTYRFIPVGDGQQNPNYSRLVEGVANSEFDAVIGDVAVTTSRARMVDFTQPYVESGLVVLAPLKRKDTRAWAFLQPFTIQMWCVTGLCLLLVGFVIWILERRINDEFRGSLKQQITTLLWFGFSTLFYTHRENTASTLGRAVLILWLFVVLIVQSSYTASLTSILTVQQLSSPLTGIATLVAGDDPIGFQTGSFAENYLVEEVGISRSRLRALGSPQEYERALELGPKNGGVVAVVDERPYIDLFLSTHCKFTIVGSEFTRSGWGFAFPRDSPLAVDLSTAILSLSETGDLQRIHDKWLTSSSCSSNSNDIESTQLHLNSFVGLFLIIGVSCLVAIAIHLCRIVKQFCRHSEVAAEGDSSSSRGLRRLQAFINFADMKEEQCKRMKMQALEEGMRSPVTNAYHAYPVAATDLQSTNACSV